MDQKGSFTLLAIMRLAGVTPEVNLRNLFHTDSKALIPLALKPRVVVVTRGICDPTKRIDLKENK